MATLVELKAALKAKGEQARKRLTDISQSCEKENRDRTADETKELEGLMQEGREIKSQIERREGDDAMAAELAKLTEGLVPVRTGVGRPGSTADAAVPGRRRQSMGQQFVDSEAFDFFKRGAHRTSSAWRSPSVELFDPAGLSGFWSPPGLSAATLVEEPASPASGGALVVPDYRPGIQPILFQRLVVADLIAPGTTESNAVIYMQEKLFTNAAAPTAEAADKPESTLEFEAMTDHVRKVAHWLPVSEEMLEDVAQIRSYIDGRLRLGVQLAEEDQLLQGDGNAPNIMGIRNRPGITPAHARGGDNNADAIFKQMMIIATTAFILPDGTVMNPTNWQTIQLLKTTTGEYLGGGPFAAPPVPRLWGVPVAVTPAIVANTATVGAFQQAAQFFRRGGVRVEASNSHADFFIKNLVAIRAEERGALAVYRPAAFGDVTGLN